MPLIYGVFNMIVVYMKLAYSVISVCFLLATGVFTQEQMKNYRSLEAYNFFRSGWVQKVFHCMSESGNFVFKADVRPSWRVTESPHHPWVAATRDGTIIAGHCDCMAGLGETCSHVAALLFKIEAAVRLGYTASVSTDELCQWNQSFVSSVEAATIDKINFYKQEAKQKVLSKTSCQRRASVTSLDQQQQLTDVQQQFLSSLASLQPPPVVLSTVNDYNSPFVVTDTVVSTRLPLALTDLYHEGNSELSLTDFDTLVSNTVQTLSVTAEESDYVESVTTAQSSCLLWHQQRAGRITASVAHPVLHSDVSKFSQSLVKRICSTEVKVLNTPAIKWGRSNESVAINIYTSLITGTPLPPGLTFPNNICMLAPPSHVNCSVQRAGFRISVEMPFIGASADGYVVCDCHGKGVIEAKCPYTDRNTSLSDLLTKDDFILDSSYAVRQNHQYSIQMQLQMYVCNVAYCDLVVWQPESILIVRVYRDAEFVTTLLPKLRDVWVRHIVPELLTRSIQKQSSISSGLAGVADSSSVAQQLAPSTSVAASDVPYEYCICRKDVGGRMIGCDNSECQYKWFHLQCIKMKRVPRKSPWFCRYCVSKSK